MAANMRKPSASYSLVRDVNALRTTGPRIRDPARKEKILAAAADLVAHSGFHAVSMADIGEKAGITGSGIYRHFESKSKILAVLFEQVIDDLLADARVTVENTPDLGQALDKLVVAQVDFVVGKRMLAQVYYNEIRNLPEEDQVRLRRKQRMYIEEWLFLLRELNRDLDETAARYIVHAAIGAIQSTLFHNVESTEARLRSLLHRSATAVLDLK